MLCRSAGLSESRRYKEKCHEGVGLPALSTRQAKSKAQSGVNRKSVATSEGSIIFPHSASPIFAIRSNE